MIHAQGVSHAQGMSHVQCMSHGSMYDSGSRYDFGNACRCIASKQQHDNAAADHCSAVKTLTHAFFLLLLSPYAH